jgi:hypothetical protein
MCADLCVCVDYGAAPEAEEGDVSTWFAPGRVVFVELLVERGMTVSQLFSIPFSYALMCLRDKDLKMLTVDMLSLFDDANHSIDILFSSWVDDLTPSACQRIGLTATRLLRDGLTRRHVKRLHLRLSTWTSLFGMDARMLDKLGITQYSDYFRDVSVDVCSAGFVPEIIL